MIKAIIFDWGGVLIEDPVKDLITFCANLLSVKNELLIPELDNTIDQFQKDTLSEKDMWIEICKNLNIQEPNNKSIWYDAVKNVFQEKKETTELIKKLKQNYKIGFLSNTEIPATKYFLEQDYSKLFDKLVFSCNEKCTKPDEKIYKIILDKLSIKPSEAIFIDDKQENIDTANKLDIHGIVYKNHSQLLDSLKKLNITI